jgi:hypothetical protein
MLEALQLLSGIVGRFEVMLPERGTVRVFRQEFTLEDAIGSHTCSLEAFACV